MEEQDIKGYSYGMKIKKFEAGVQEEVVQLLAAKFALYSSQGTLGAITAATSNYAVIFTE